MSILYQKQQRKVKNFIFINMLFYTQSLFSLTIPAFEIKNALSPPAVLCPCPYLTEICG